MKKEHLFIPHWLKIFLLLHYLTFCQPNSEINQILGLNQNEHYNLVLKQNIERLISMGITFCSINEVEDNLKKNAFDHNLKIY